MRRIEEPSPVPIRQGLPTKHSEENCGLLMSKFELYNEAIERCRSAFDRAQQLGLQNPLAMSLATVGSDGVPSNRMVLLRGFDERGFVFYTNSESRKGQQMAKDPVAALCFYWEGLNEQIRVEGTIAKVSEQENDAYWESRPRLSQLAARASRQSNVLDNRQDYYDTVATMDREFADNSVPRPSFWYGYRVIPNRIEWWVGRDGRMHERTVYEKTEGDWERYMLYP